MVTLTPLGAQTARITMPSIGTGLGGHSGAVTDRPSHSGRSNQSPGSSGGGPLTCKLPFFVCTHTCFTDSVEHLFVKECVYVCAKGKVSTIESLPVSERVG